MLSWLIPYRKLVRINTILNVTTMLWIVLSYYRVGIILYNSEEDNQVHVYVLLFLEFSCFQNFGDFFQFSWIYFLRVSCKNHVDFNFFWWRWNMSYQLSLKMSTMLNYLWSVLKIQISKIADTYNLQFLIL